MNDLKKSRKLVESYLSEWVSDLPDTGLYEPMRYLLSMEAKRVRPAMLLMAAEMFGVKPENAIDEALAIEVFHNFSLMHDDIMDEAPLRRGQPTVHSKWDVSTAILSGDAMLVKAYQLMGQNAKALQVFSRYALQVCEGQQLDMDFEKLDTVSLDEYKEMIRLKTAVLLSCSLQIGAIIGRATGAEVQHMGAFGEQLGLVFQLKDDLLDVFGDPTKVGKQQGGDLRAGKKTWLLIKGLELSKQQDRTELIDELKKPAAERDVIRMAAVLEELGARDQLMDAISRAHQTAMAHMDSIPLPEKQKKHLVALAESLLERVH
jgi:geranylgeranyl diphosphate synthase type II